MEKLINIINQILDSKKDQRVVEIKSKSNLRSDLGLDSLDLAELTVKIEDEFGVDVFADGIVNTVEEIYRKLV